MEQTEKVGEKYPGVFPSCIVTQARAQRRAEKKNLKEGNNEEMNMVIDLSQTCQGHEGESKLILEKTLVQNCCDSNEVISDIPGTWKSIADEQRDDKIILLFSKALPEEELTKVLSAYFVKDEILMRKWKPSHIPTLKD